MTPSLRFPEFRGEWTHRPLSAFIEEYREASTHRDQYEVLTSSRFGLVKQRDYFDNDRIIERDNTGFNVIPPSFITYRSRSDNRSFYFNRNDLGIKGIVSVYYPVFRIRNGSDNFFINLLTCKSRYIGRFSVGTSQTVLSLNELRRIKLAVPEIDEQKKISDFLGTVDERIKLLQRRLTALAQYKTGMTQRLFDQTLRFIRDDGTGFPDWQKVRLGDIATFAKGRGISKEDIVEGGGVPCIRYGELYTVYSERIDRVISRTDVPYKHLLLSEKDDVILPASGEMPLDMASASCVTLSGIALGGDINIIRSSLDGLFLAYLLRGPVRRPVARLAQGNSVVHLYGSHLAGLRFYVPADPDEQRKISSFLGALDDKCVIMMKLLSQMQLFKKSLLQKMFA